LRCFIWTSIWIGSRIAAELCGNMIPCVRFVCYGSAVCDGFLALRRGGTRRACGTVLLFGSLLRLGTFGMLLSGARIARVVALDCIDVSCH